MASYYAGIKLRSVSVIKNTATAIAAAPPMALLELPPVLRMNFEYTQVATLIPIKKAISALDILILYAMASWLARLLFFS